MLNGDDMKKIRTYLDVVPEDKKEEISRTWGDMKRKTFVAAKDRIVIDQEDSFNKVVAFTLGRGHYHMSSSITFVNDVSDHKEIRSEVGKLMRNTVNAERENGFVPLLASNICDWDSGFAKDVGADTVLIDAVINGCIENGMVLTGGETANLGDQVRKKGISWMLTILSMHQGGAESSQPRRFKNNIDRRMQYTFQRMNDGLGKFEMAYVNGFPVLHVKEESKFIMTSDGTGSKSIICELVRNRSDPFCVLAMAGDDAPREGAFPVIASLGVDAEHLRGRKQTLSYMAEAGGRCSIPIVGSVYHQSDNVYTYIMNGTILSEIREGAALTGKEIVSGLPLVVLHEEQRSNGITLQRRIFEDAFGSKWYKIRAVDAFKALNGRLGSAQPEILQHGHYSSLGELVSRHSTPYFSADTRMPEELLDSIKFRVNVSSGGIIGKTRRLLEPHGLGADYDKLFDAPELILLLQMASRTRDSKGIIPDLVAYYTWGCGNGAVIGTGLPDKIVEYYSKSGIRAKKAGTVIADLEIRIKSSCLDSKIETEPLIVTHRYSEAQLG